MLKIDRNSKSFVRLEAPTFKETEITERQDFQEFIWNSPNEFFAELGEDLFLLKKEVVPSDTVQDRIDLLALDPEGNAVIIELKRGNHKLHMLQAISYAGMISKWTADRFLGLITEERTDELVDFLQVEKEDINRQQRIILIAEAYDYALLTAAEWLSENYGCNVTCCRVSLAKDRANEYLACSNVYPLPELAHQAVTRGKAKAVRQLKWSDWETALAGIPNQAIAGFFRSQVEAGQESYLRKRTLRYRINGKRRWFVTARQNNAYAWQYARFQGDEEFWRKRLSQPDEVQPVKDGACLRFFLKTDDDFRQFLESVQSTLLTAIWLAGTADDSDAPDDEDGDVE